MVKMQDILALAVLTLVPQAADAQVGVWQYCSDVSGAALEDFMLKYPYTDSPEPTSA